MMKKGETYKQYSKRLARDLEAAYKELNETLNDQKIVSHSEKQNLLQLKGDMIKFIDSIYQNSSVEVRSQLSAMKCKLMFWGMW